MVTDHRSASHQPQRRSATYVEIDRPRCTSQQLRCRRRPLGDDEVPQQHAERLGLHRPRVDDQQVIAEEAFLFVVANGVIGSLPGGPRLLRGSLAWGLEGGLQRLGTIRSGALTFRGLP
jgi:hypothetical protein